jgi:hypothetical protein
MVAEVYAGLGAFKTMFDLAKGLKDIDDRTTRNAVAIELQEKILAAQQQQASLIQKVSALEKEVADMKAWEADKQRYELKKIGHGAVAYMLKPHTRGAEPPHWLCPNCYAQHKKAYFQPTGEERHRAWIYRCQGCQGILTGPFEPKWVD